MSGRNRQRAGTRRPVQQPVRNTAEQERPAKKQRRRGYFDYNLLVVIIFLVGFGLVMLYSTSYYQAQLKYNGDGFHYFKRQAIISLGSMIFMMVVSRIDYRFWKRFALLGYAAAIVSVGLLLSPLGITRNEATRWLGITETLSFQPAELCKIALIVFIPYLIVKMGHQIKTIKGMLVVLVAGGFVSFLILVISENLSTAIILAGITVIMLYVVHPKGWTFWPIGGALIAAVWAFINLVIRPLETSEDFRFRRIIAWLNPEKFADDYSYQTMQALYAIGSGGLFGKGLGNSAQKMIIPEVQNDMIFSVICEELGMFGVAIVVLLFAIMLYRLIFIAQNAPDLYGSLMVTGIFAHIAIQVVLNIAVVTNVIPNTGITLPFISYGGTSILFLMSEMGLALSVSRQIEIKD